MTDDIKCPICGSKTTLRTFKKTGSKYHVCVNYPHCNGRVLVKPSHKKPVITGANSFVMKHIKRTNRNLLVLYIIIFIVCSVITTLVFITGGLHKPFDVCLAITLLLTVVFIVTYTIRLSNIERHPIYKSLTKFGNFDSVRAQIDAEAVSNTSVSKGGLRFTQNWVIRPYFETLLVIQRSTLVWAYAKDLATRHSINFIPVGTTHTYSVLINYTEPAKRRGMVNVRNFEIRTSNEEASRDLLGYILLYAPWIVAGYTPEVAYLWKKKTSEILTYVANRYNAFIFDKANQGSQQRSYAEQPTSKADTLLFEVLGVSPSATESEVKAAYRNKAKTIHPDLGGSHKSMIELNIAYAAICRLKGWAA